MDTKPKKKPVNGKSKGSGFELDIAKLFTATFTPLQFKRTPGSGAYIGGINARFAADYSDESRQAFTSDIFVANETDVIRNEGWAFRFAIECKFYKEADNFTALFKNPQVRGWWDQAYGDSKKLAAKEPMLVFKFNRTPIFAGVRADLEIPNNITAAMTLNYNDESAKAIRIVPMLELLQHPTWWKRSTQTS